MEEKLNTLRETIKLTERTIVDMTSAEDRLRIAVAFGTDNVESLITKQGPSYILHLDDESLAPIELPLVDDFTNLPIIKGAEVTLNGRNFEIKAVKLGLGIVIYTTEILTQESLPQAA